MLYCNQEAAQRLIVQYVLRMESSENFCVVHKWNVHTGC